MVRLCGIPLVLLTRPFQPPHPSRRLQLRTGTSESVHTYNALIKACDQAGDYDSAISLFREMGKAGIEPNSATRQLVRLCLDCPLHKLCSSWSAPPSGHTTTHEHIIYSAGVNLISKGRGHGFRSADPASGIFSCCCCSWCSTDTSGFLLTRDRDDDDRNAGPTFPVWRSSSICVVVTSRVRRFLSSASEEIVSGRAQFFCGGSTSGAGAVDDEAVVGYYLIYRFRNRLWKSERMVSLMKRFCAAAISVVSEDGNAKGHSAKGLKKQPRSSPEQHALSAAAPHEPGS